MSPSEPNKTPGREKSLSRDFTEHPNRGAIFYSAADLFTTGYRSEQTGIKKLGIGVSESSLVLTSTDNKSCLVLTTLTAQVRIPERELPSMARIAAKAHGSARITNTDWILAQLSVCSVDKMPISTGTVNQSMQSATVRSK